MQQDLSSVLLTRIQIHISASLPYIRLCLTVLLTQSIQARIPRLLRLNSSSLTVKPAITLRQISFTAVRMIFSRIWIPMNVTGSSEHLLRQFTSPSLPSRMILLLRSFAEAMFSTRSSLTPTIRQCSYAGRWNSWRRSFLQTSHLSEA